MFKDLFFFLIFVIFFFKTYLSVVKMSGYDTLFQFRILKLLTLGWIYSPQRWIIMGGKRSGRGIYIYYLNFVIYFFH